MGFPASPGPPAIVLPALEPNARIERSVAEIHEEVDQQKDGAHKDHKPLNHRVVPIEDGVEHEFPDPRPSEDRFDDDRTTEQTSKAHARHSHHRSQGVAEGMADNDGAAPEP